VEVSISSPFFSRSSGGDASPDPARSVAVGGGPLEDVLRMPMFAMAVRSEQQRADY